MTVFFFVVGLEIRHELHAGELRDRKRAALPAFAAMGGMLAPAGLYLACNWGAPAPRGWGVPMATDIAFAVGVLALLGPRVPPALRILLLALAVIDDLGAIIVIALFYSTGFAPAGLLLAAAGIGLILTLQRRGMGVIAAYGVPALLVWLGAYRAGIHPTIAGVVIGLLTPVVAGTRLKEALHRWVAFALMPLFALANAGVEIGTVALGGDQTRIFAGVALGLALGKPLGVLALCRLAVWLRLAALPDGVAWPGLAVVGLVAGIGFTMALFIAGLAFGESREAETAKLAVLSASALAAVTGLLVGRLALPPATRS